MVDRYTFRVRSFGCCNMNLEKGVTIIGYIHIVMLCITILRLLILLSMAFGIQNDWWSLLELLVDIFLVWGPKSFVFWKLLKNRNSQKMRLLYFRVNLATVFKFVMRYIVFMVVTIVTTKKSRQVNYIGELSVGVISAGLLVGLFVVLGIVFWFQMVIWSYYLELADKDKESDISSPKKYSRISLEGKSSMNEYLHSPQIDLDQETNCSYTI